jgi:hypothetical protein
MRISALLDACTPDPIALAHRDDGNPGQPVVQDPERYQAESAKLGDIELPRCGYLGCAEAAEWLEGLVTTNRRG